MQQGGESNTQQYFMGGASAAADQSQQSSQMVVEEASPISSRPPASSVNLDEFMSGSGGGFSEMDALATAAAGDDPDRGGGGGGGGGNRWPRQETLALLKIRSEMDAAFRDATVKGPLWEDVSRKLAELGYKRSAKKCKEKFENVDKYYKRTKEGRAGRQDGKAYKFFSELEALHNTATSQAAPPPMATTSPSTAGTFSFPGIGFSSPMPISSIRPLLPTTSITSAPLPPQPHPFPSAAAGAPPFTTSSMRLDFSSNSSSSSPETEDDAEYNEGSCPEGEPSNVAGSSRKRKRGGGGGGSSRRMMEFFEGLMKQVMQKQEAMQQKFLEAIEKNEQERSTREEAWRRQEMARLAREHEIMAQERAVSASRDASIMAFLQKITGQTIQLPSPPPAVVTTAPITIAQLSTPARQPIHVPVQLPPSYQQQKSQQRPGNVETARHMDVVLEAVPEQQVRAPEAVGGGRSSELPSSRWPRTEVLALIKLRSGLESRYQEAGPKGPLWEEISAGMQRVGYSRSAKRCKEKWENINKYFKKVKESNKKRPEDSKTCPYFHELDALYRKKILASGNIGSIGGSEGAGSSDQQVQHHTDAPVTAQEQQPLGAHTAREEAKDGGSSGRAVDPIEEENGEAKKPEDTVIELIGGNHHQQNLDLQLKHVNLSSNAADKNGFELQHCDLSPGQDEDEEDIVNEDEEGGGGGGGEAEPQDQERKTAYKIEFHQQSSRGNAAGPPNGGGSGGNAAKTTSVMAMVQ